MEVRRSVSAARRRVRSVAARARRELLARRHRSPAGPAAPSLDDHRAFIRRVFVELLDREPDDGGMQHFLDRFAEGRTEADVVLEIADSAEFTTAVIAGRRLHAPGREDLPDLTAERPEKYALMPTPTQRRVLAFHAAEPADFDWLEERIKADGYYERPGVWSLERDTDKVLMAELLGSLSPRRSLELGCSTGAVMAGLVEQGSDAWGVDPSVLARGHAEDHVRDRIITGDLLEVELPGTFDLVYGLDVFEHLNPNRLDRYIAHIAERLEPQGRLFVNIPVFGVDEVFGQVSPYHLVAWEDEEAPQPFRWLHVDDRGWPLHGHLIWARAAWWVAQFERVGLEREPGIERSLHARYDRFFDETGPARKQFFVFRRR